MEPKNFGPLLTRLLAIADDAVIVTDAAQKIVLFNEGAERVFGYDLSQVLGQSLTMLLPESARAAHEGHLRTFAASTMPARRMADRRDIHGRRADGSLFDAEASISHVELDGQLFFAAILRDVSRVAPGHARAGTQRGALSRAGDHRTRGHLPDRFARPVRLCQRTLERDGGHDVDRGRRWWLAARGAPRPTGPGCRWSGTPRSPTPSRSSCSTVSCARMATRPGSWGVRCTAATPMAP